MNRTERLKMLCSAYDVASQLPIYDQIHIYVEMITFDEVKIFAEPEITRIKEQLVADRDYTMLDVLKNCLHNIGIEFNYNLPAPTFYTSSQNVHILAKSTEKTALEIIGAYPSIYTRPARFSAETYDFFFHSIENFSFHSFEPKDLFASVYTCILSSKNMEEMLERLKEEILDSQDMCLTGCIGRLVNALRGFGIEEFETKIDKYEQERSKTFYQITKSLKDLNNLLPEIKQLVNDKNGVKLSRKFGKRILEAYTGVPWTKRNGKWENCLCDYKNDKKLS